MLKKLLCALLALMLTAGCALAQTEVSGLTWESELPVEYADQFTVDFYEGGYALIQIVDGGAFLLVPEGMDAPDGLSADVCVLIGKKHTLPIQDGLRDAGFNMDNAHVFASLSEATTWLQGFMRPGDYVLYENDLPDHYTEN